MKTCPHARMRPVNEDVSDIVSLDGGEEMNSLSSNCRSGEFQLFSPLRRLRQIKAATEGLGVLILVLARPSSHPWLFVPLRVER